MTTGHEVRTTGEHPASVSYSARRCTDQARIERFLATTRTGVLGIGGGHYPYVVPMNFVWHDGAVYLHGLGSGHKNDLLDADGRVCFTVFRDDGTVPDAMPCHADTAYFSVMVFGTARRVTDPAEATAALQAIVDKFAPGAYRTPLAQGLVERYTSDLDRRPVAVFRVDVDSLTAKENAAPPP